MTLSNQDMFDLIDDIFRVSNIKLLNIAPFPDNAAVLTTLNDVRSKSSEIQEKLNLDNILVKPSLVFGFKTILTTFEKSTTVTFLSDLQSILTFLTELPSKCTEQNGEEVSDNGDSATDNNNTTP